MVLWGGNEDLMLSSGIGPHDGADLLTLTSYILHHSYRCQSHERAAFSLCSLPCEDTMKVNSQQPERESLPEFSDPGI